MARAIDQPAPAGRAAPGAAGRAGPRGRRGAAPPRLSALSSLQEKSRAEAAAVQERVGPAGSEGEERPLGSAQPPWPRVAWVRGHPVGALFVPGGDGSPWLAAQAAPPASWDFSLKARRPPGQTSHGPGLQL